MNQPPPGWRPQAPARIGSRVLAIVLLNVFAVVLVAALTYALVLRPMLGGGPVAPSPGEGRATDHPILEPGERFPWGQHPPANLGDFKPVLATTIPPTFL